MHKIKEIIRGSSFKENRKLASNKYNNGDIFLKQYFCILLSFHSHCFVKKANLREIRRPNIDSHASFVLHRDPQLRETVGAKNPLDMLLDARLC